MRDDHAIRLCVRYCNWCVVLHFFLLRRWFLGPIRSTIAYCIRYRSILIKYDEIFMFSDFLTLKQFYNGYCNVFRNCNQLNAILTVILIEENKIEDIDRLKRLELMDKNGIHSFPFFAFCILYKNIFHIAFAWYLVNLFLWYIHYQAISFIKFHYLLHTTNASSFYSIINDLDKLWNT